MAQGATLQVKNLTGFLRALGAASKADKKAVYDELRAAGEVVRSDASRRISPKNSRTAAGYRTRVRQKGVGVQQSLRKTTGAHGQWGSYQMRHALLPALYANEDEMMRNLEHALDRVADHFNHAGLG